MTKQSIELLQQDIDTLRLRQECLQKQLDELRTQQQPEKLEMWKPAEDEVFFTIHDTGDGTASYQGYIDYPMDCYFIGNCFPTQELAEYYAKRRAARQRLEMLALAENEMVPYEFKYRNSNYYISAYLNKLLIESYNETQEGHQYFPSKEAAQRVLDAMTDEDLITLFGTANRGGK